MAIVRVALEGLGGQEQTFPVGRGEADLTAELVALMGLALGDADHLGGME